MKMGRRGGLATVATERYFGMRNNYYRWKRRRAARKFEVYMRKQDRVVKFDDDGRYIAPDDERHSRVKEGPCPSQLDELTGSDLHFAVGRQKLRCGMTNFRIYCTESGGAVSPA